MAGLLIQELVPVGLRFLDRFKVLGAIPVSEHDLGSGIIGFLDLKAEELIGLLDRFFLDFFSVPAADANLGLMPVSLRILTSSLTFLADSFSFSGMDGVN